MPHQNWRCLKENQKDKTNKGKLLIKNPIKKDLFPDFNGGIKSLGAWGGDFFLATGDRSEMKYFHDKGFTTIIPYRQMCL